MCLAYLIKLCHVGKNLFVLLFILFYPWFSLAFKMIIDYKGYVATL